RAAGRRAGEGVGALGARPRARGADRQARRGEPVVRPARRLAAERDRDADAREPRAEGGGGLAGADHRRRDPGDGHADRRAEPRVLVGPPAPAENQALTHQTMASASPSPRRDASTTAAAKSAARTTQAASTLSGGSTG